MTTEAGPDAPPDPPEAFGPPEPLGSAVLPVLMHRLNNATQLLSALNAIASTGGGDAWLSKRSADLAHAGATVDELGYVLAVLASAGGADLLLERRRPDGLTLMLASVRDALRRDARDLAPLEAPVPTLDPHAGRGWELPWAVGALAFVAADASGAPLHMEVLTAGESGMTVRLPGAALGAVEDLESALRARVASVRIEALDDELLVQLAVPRRRAE